MRPQLMVLAALCCGSTLGITQPLDGEWRLNNPGRAIHLPARVPGGVYSDLQSGGLLNDTLYRFNDEEYRWVAYENWTYTTTFNVSQNMLQKRHLVIVFHGVDTVADILLNDQMLGSTDNMFVRYQFPVKNLLRASGNVLKVELASPTVSAAARYREQARRYVVPPPCVDEAYHGECHVNFLRKMQASFAWDWGPAFPSVGVWRSVELLSYDGANLRDVTVRYTEVNKNISMDFDYLLETGTGEGQIEGKLVASLVYNDTTVFTSERNHTIKLNSNETEHHASHHLSFQDDIELWYPNGLGKQKMYNMSFQFISNNGTEKIQIHTRYGFVTHKLIEEPVDEKDVTKGTTFHIRTNGLDYFHKGVNWIPANILPERASDEKTLRSLLQAVRDAHMNIVRVWGGGLYESDLFYDLADEYGITVWQDFMFACSMYPVGAEFLASVRAEVSQQVRRLQSHPSVAVWAGNNENEGALRDNWYGTGSDFQLYKKDYVTLYVDTIMKSVQATDGTRDFVVSSPSNGWKTVKEGYVAENPGDVLYGDIHYYNYDINGWDSTRYSVPRFSSEYGFQSYPSLGSLQEVAEPSDLVFSSKFVSHRQHHPSGNDEIVQQVQRNMPFTLNESSVENFASLIFLSQINQAMSIKTETEHYRRSQSLLTAAGQGRTMGAMYWQLNDVWQAPSWSSIEFDGRWKMLHYYAKNFFAPVLLSPYVTSDGSFEVAAISDIDYNETVRLNFDIMVMTYDSFTPLYTEQAATRLVLNKPVISISKNMNNFLSTAGCGSEPTAKCFIYIRPAAFTDIIEEVPDNFLFLGRVPGARRSGLAVSEVAGPNRTASGEDRFSLLLTCDAPALWVWLEAARHLPPGRFSDNGFQLVVRRRRLTYTTAPGAVTTEQLRAALSVTSLGDQLAASSGHSHSLPADVYTV
ncbi:beta-mannosidase-like [Bacillus rossius redtenbacheri]|uniref:beta-mannosidase-like n=1 Tax=Bacillus rossius redtenbacheri TaxID=93214 RepID=UPI002FDCB3D3